MSPMSPMSPCSTHRSTIDRMGSTVHSFSNFSATQHDTLKKSRSDSNYHLGLVHKRRARRAELVQRILEEQIQEPDVETRCPMCAEYKANGQDSIRLLTLENEHLRRGIGCLLQLAKAMLSEKVYQELRANLHLNVRYFTGFGVDEFEALGDIEILSKGVRAELGRVKASRDNDPGSPQTSVPVSEKEEPEQEEQPEPKKPVKRRLLGARERTEAPKPEDKMVQCNLLAEHEEPCPVVLSQPASPKTPTPAQNIPPKEKTPAKEKDAPPDTTSVVEVSDTLKIRKGPRTRIGTPLGMRGSSSGSLARTASPLADPTLHQVQGLGEDIPPHSASSPPMSSHSQRLSSPSVTRVRANKPSMEEPVEQALAETPVAETPVAVEEEEKQDAKKLKVKGPEANSKRTVVGGAGPSLGASRSRAPRATPAVKESPDLETSAAEKPEVVDMCVGGGPGPGLADLAKEESKIPPSPNPPKAPRRRGAEVEEMNKHKHMYDRKLRTGPRMTLNGVTGFTPAVETGSSGPRAAMAATGSWGPSNSSNLASAGMGNELTEGKAELQRRGTALMPPKSKTKSAAQLAADLQLQRLAEAEEKYQDFMDEQPFEAPKMRRASLVTC